MPARRGAHLGEHEHLVAEVEARGRLVHDDGGASWASARAISASWRWPPLMRVYSCVGEVRDAELRRGASSALAPVLARRRGEQRQVRRAAHHHHVEHA